MQIFTETIPLSLYIHIPWCVRKCPYCDFNSHEAKQPISEESYIDALLKDLEEQLPSIWGRRLTSIFFGGGTPSLFSPTAIEKILLGVNARLPFSSDLEITLEANPGTVDESRFQGFRHAGINRLSLGIQSLQDDKLLKLGRIHNRDYALRAIDTAMKVGFDNINLDLMHGLPGQTLADALADLNDALHWQPPHLSWYQLTIEPNTLYHHRPPALPADETLWDIQEEGKKILTQSGLIQYEVSAYCKDNLRSNHNMNYWEFGDYLGIGAGAHSKITDFEKQIVNRHWQVKNPKDYLNPEKNVVACKKPVAPADLIFEFMLNALRLNAGVPFHLFTARTGLSPDIIRPILKTAIDKNLLVDSSIELKPTPLGHLFLNDLTSLFLPNS